MNSYLRQRIQNELSLFASGEDGVRNCNNPQKAFEYIEQHFGGGDFREIWQSVAQGFEAERRRARKDPDVADATHLEASFRFEIFMQRKRDPSQSSTELDCDDKKRMNELNSILDLIDVAIVNCPIKRCEELAAMFALRSIVHAEAKQSKHASMVDGQNESETKFEKQEEEVDEEEDQNSNRESVENDSSPNGLLDFETPKFNFDFHGHHRKIVANGDIAEQTLLFRESPYSVVLLPEQLLRKCNYCWRDVSHRFRSTCTSCNEVVYCDDRCRRLDWSSPPQSSSPASFAHRHERECGLVRFWSKRSKSSLHVFRLLNRLDISTILDLFQRQQQSQSEQDNNLLHHYMRDIYRQQAQSQTGESFLESQKTIKTFEAFLSLAHHSDKFSSAYFGKHMLDAIECAICAFVVQEFSDFDQIERDHLLLFVSHCFVGIRRVQVNSFRWSESTYDRRSTRSVAIVVCLLASLFDHSCEHNAEWIFADDGTFRLHAIDAISQGDEITINYGVTSRTHSFEQRRRANWQYHFQCKCGACRRNVRDVAAALQCVECIGPVLVLPRPEADNQRFKTTGICLLCDTISADSGEKFDQLLCARKELHLVSRLLPMINANQAREEEETILVDRHRCYIRRLKHLLDEICSLSYRESNRLAADICAACRVFHRFGRDDLCRRYGQLVDQIISSYDFHHNGEDSEDGNNFARICASLFTLPPTPLPPNHNEQDNETEETEEAEEEEEEEEIEDIVWDEDGPKFNLEQKNSSTTTIDRLFHANIANLLFWSNTVYRRYRRENNTFALSIVDGGSDLDEQSANNDNRLAKLANRFHERACQAIAAAIKYKQLCLAQISNDNDEKKNENDSSNDDGNQNNHPHPHGRRNQNQQVSLLREEIMIFRELLQFQTQHHRQQQQQQRPLHVDSI